MNQKVNRLNLKRTILILIYALTFMVGIGTILAICFMDSMTILQFKIALGILLITLIVENLVSDSIELEKEKKTHANLPHKSK